MRNHRGIVLLNGFPCYYAFYKLHSTFLARDILVANAGTPLLFCA